MTKFKKILTGSLSVAALATVATVATSCEEEKFDLGRTYLVTDSGSVEDKSFNEQAYQALKTILKGTEFKAEQSYNSPSQHDVATIANGYNSAQTAGAGTIIAPGFYHAGSIKNYFSKVENPLNFIVIDASVSEFKENNAYKRIAGITYKTNQAAFLAGVFASRYLVEVVQDETPTVGMWGGGPFPGVTDFMTGFYEGVRYFNEVIFAKLDKTKFPKARKVKFALPGDFEQIISTGFNAGGGRAMATTLIDGGADVILPVAGSQTQDLITVIGGRQKSDSDRIKIIGVDTDQKLAFTKNEGYFLTSIEKKIKDGILKVTKRILTAKNAQIPSGLVDVNIDDSIKGFGEDTVGTLNNNLVGVSTPSTNLIGGKAAEAQKLYEEVKKDADVLKAAKDEKRNPSGTWLKPQNKKFEQLFNKLNQEAGW